MSENRKLFLMILITILMTLVITPPCYGNSAEPPSILIIVPNAPEDLKICIGSGDTYAEARKTDKIMESYYTFYSHELQRANDYTIKISTEDSAFEILLKPIKHYNNIYSLDLKRQTLAPGKLLSRSLFLVFLRITFTLIIEAAVFWLFGFRDKRSWIAFGVINLMTQGALNIWLNGLSPLLSYVILTLIFGEILVFIAEIIAFFIFIKEHQRLRIFLYVIIANLFSLGAGGYMISVLPI